MFADRLGELLERGAKGEVEAEVADVSCRLGTGLSDIFDGFDASLLISAAYDNIAPIFEEGSCSLKPNSRISSRNDDTPIMICAYHLIFIGVYKSMQLIFHRNSQIIKFDDVMQMI